MLDEWDSVRTGHGFTEVHKTVFFPESADDPPLDPEGQLPVWGCHVLLRDLQGAVHQYQYRCIGTAGSLQHGVLNSLRTSSSLRGLPCWCET